MISAIVLAAGLSSRMEHGNKLLQDLHGKLVICHVVETLILAGLRDIVVVTGHDADRVEHALSDHSVRFAFNEKFHTGQAGSVAKGIRHVKDEADGALICLGDMPVVKADTIRALLDAFEGAERQQICVPFHEGRRGNPVLWPRQCFHRLLQLHGDEGARAILADLKSDLVHVDVPDDGIFADADTNEALQTMRQKPQT